MSIFGKIAFWKHDTIPSPSNTAPDMGINQDRTGIQSESGFPDEIGQNSDSFEQSMNTGIEPSMPQQGFGQPSQLQKLEPLEETPASQPSAFSQLNQNNPSQSTNNIETLSKNVEIISSKMDTIKAILDNLSHKIERIEKIADGEKEKPAQQYGGW
jgi:hypothetical protein